MLTEVAHRPWAMPNRPWIMTQTWHDLLFAHWPVDPQHLRSKIPRAFEIDLFGAEAWVGIVPFYMTNVAPRGIPSLPGLSAFPELNVRTYVRVDDRPGVYFFSLDAGSSVAVHAARHLLNLPYFRASMNVAADAKGIRYQSRRRANLSAEFVATYEPIGAPSVAAAGTIEYFLTERYCLYEIDRSGKPYRLDIHHRPWSLQPAMVHIERNSMAGPAQIDLSDPPSFVHFSKRQDTVAWGPARFTDERAGGRTRPHHGGSRAVRL